MRILIIGLGSIGKRHARILKEMGGHELFALRSPSQAEKGTDNTSLSVPFSSRGEGLDIRELHSWEEVDRLTFDVALITNPTFRHIETALECARRNMHLFIEKPIDSKLDGLDELTELVNQRHLTAYVAYPLRFHPVIQELKKKLEGQKVLHSRAVSASYLPDWRSKGVSPSRHPERKPTERAEAKDLIHEILQSPSGLLQDDPSGKGKTPRRVTYSSFRDQGGGVLLDLSHEIDTIEYLFGEIKDIQGVFGRQSNVTIDAEDFCDLDLSHPHGVTNLHLNLFSFSTQRFIEVDTDAFYVKGDLNNFQLTIKDRTSESTLDFPNDYDAMFRSQMRYFLNHLGRPEIQNNLETAGKLFRKVIQFRNGKEYSCHPLR